MLQLLSTNIDLVKKTIFNKVYFLCFSFFLLSFIQKDSYPVNCREKVKALSSNHFQSANRLFLWLIRNITLPIIGLTEAFCKKDHRIENLVKSLYYASKLCGCTLTHCSSAIKHCFVSPACFFRNRFTQPAINFNKCISPTTTVVKFCIFHM